MATTLPDFQHIQIKTISTNLSQLLDRNREQIKDLLAQSDFNWDNLMLPLEELDNDLHQFWAPINHLNAVMNSPELRDAYAECLPKLSDYGTELSHNTKLYEAIGSIADSDEYKTLEPAQRKIIDNELRDFKLAGVSLLPEKKKQFAKLCKELAQLTNQFEENVLDATMGWTKHITDEKALSGIPEHAIAAAKQTAEKNSQTGWLFTLEMPSYLAVMTYADNQDLRKDLYYAYSTRASDQGPNAGKWDNTPVMQAILEKRLQLAKLLGFSHYAEYSLATKMVKKPQDVIDFLEKLLKASKEKAHEEFKALKNFAKKELNLTELNAWDLTYAAEKLRQHRYALSQEDLRPYFAEDKVVAGLFDIAQKLFGITIKEIKTDHTWHPDVHCYEVYNSQDNIQAYFYTDLYARENKRGGAWMDDSQARRITIHHDLQLPIAYINCNFNAPVDNKPALWTHDDVVTLFHEFGHSLQHMLTTVNYADVSGINGIPWDAVEIASQFMENWAREQESLALFAKHYQTNALLPQNLFDKIHRSRNFQSALAMLRQLEFSLFDFKLHMEFNPEKPHQVQQILDDIRHEISVIPVPAFNRFAHSFSHIFAGGYAAGYYSYKWAEVMASDAFSLFEEKGLFDPTTSQQFLTTFLQSGGAVEPLKLFEQYRGRKPDITALLKQTGIIEKGVTHEGS